MTQLDELKRRLRDLQRAPLLVKAAPAEAAIICAVDVLDVLEARISNLEQAGLKAGPQPKGGDHGENQGG